MQNTAQSENPSRWSSTLWRSGSGHSDWRQWELCYTNQEMDHVIQKEDVRAVGVQAGALSQGFDEQHFGEVFRRAFLKNQEVRSIFRLSFNQTPEVYLFFLLLPLDENHMATFFTDVTEYFTGPNAQIWHKDVSVEFKDYALDQDVIDILEKQKQRIMAMWKEIVSFSQEKVSF